MLKPGDTFLLPKHESDPKHLWVVLTEPNTETGLAVCVNITTRQSYSENTVVLAPGEHPFIKHESVVYYSDAQELNLKELEAVLNSHHAICEQRQSCDPALLEKIQQGLLVSQFVKKRIKEYCRKLWMK